MIVERYVRQGFFRSTITPFSACGTASRMIVERNAGPGAARGRAWRVSIGLIENGGCEERTVGRDQSAR